jgi:hypothetical protein
MAKFNCSASGDPFPVFKWQRNGIILEPSEHYTMSFYNISTPCIQDKICITGSELIVREPIVAADGTVYKCVASNVAGDAFSNDALLHLYTPPEITVQPIPPLVDPGMSSC